MNLIDELDMALNIVPISIFSWDLLVSSLDSKLCWTSFLWCNGLDENCLFKSVLSSVV